MTERDTIDLEPIDADLILVGAGLANGLIAYRLARRFPALQILMLEGAEAAFGNHTWSFHATDLDPQARDWVAPLVAHSWSGQAVRFVSVQRRLDTGYGSLTSESMARGLAGLANVTIRTGAKVETVLPDGVVLANGERLAASCVIDARGQAPSQHMVLGFQKFVGIEVETLEPHGLAVPTIMDASVDQLDGYRFIYLLPLSPNRVLIEDTRYADGGALAVESLKDAIRHYAQRRGWAIRRELREEQGVLPIALAFNAQRFWAEKPQDVPQAGMRAGLFHPTTGYSLPEAVRVADLVARHWPIASPALARKIKAHALARARAQGFYRLLNRMLFKAAEPGKRHLVLQRFYKLPQPLIERFYAGRTTLGDIARILTGRPPVPVGRALTCLSEAALLNSKRVQ